MPDPTVLTRTMSTLQRLLPSRFRPHIPVVPVVRLAGVIGFSTPLRPGLTLSSVARMLERAFSLRNARAVAISINSPGGSAVQSHLIFQRIRSLADEHKLPVIVFIEDVAASGGYMIACAGDEIISDASSIVGSIGVMGGSFGFNKLMEKLGIERRIYTSGERKVMLDPFLPEKPEDVERLKAIQKQIHESFIALVQARRGTRLDGRETALFSGEFWTGIRARELGLVDAIGDLRSALRERYGDNVITPLIIDRGLFGRRMPGIAAGGWAYERPGLVEELISALEARALWARYGL
ncbi:MAG TPA: S49 family peptidase [Xanthobacteraceae bacterium]|nr:S49 family peptidase [Xanthobacteraceae bacterium]